MRRSTVNLVAVWGVALFVGNWAAADGPQFTGLMNFYDPIANGFVETRNSLAVMDKDGPIAGTVVPLAGNWSDIVISPDLSKYYAITTQDVYRIDAHTGAQTHLVINSPVPPGEDHSWTVGETWDPVRNRLVVATLGGTGFMFGYFDATDQWTTIADFHQLDQRAIAYRPSNDTFYALRQEFVGPTSEMRKYSPTGQLLGSITLSQPLPQAQGSDSLAWQMMLASDGQLAVIAPDFVPGPGGISVPGSILYLINPDSGVVTYQGPLPVPEPGMMGLIGVAAAYLVRRRR